MLASAPLLSLGQTKWCVLPIDCVIRNCHQKENLHTSFDIMQGTVTTPESYDRLKALSSTGEPAMGEELDWDEMVDYCKTRTNLAEKYSRIPIFKKDEPAIGRCTGVGQAR